MPEESIENQTSSSAKRGGFLSKLIIFIIVIGIIVAISYAILQTQGGAIAIVNGEKITKAQYNERYSKLALTVASQGQSATSTEIMAAMKKQVTDDLVSETLVLQEAKKAGISANTDAVDAAIKQSQAQFPDNAGYEKALKDQGFTDMSYKSTLTTQNIIQQYLSTHVDLTTAVSTPAEVTTLYNQAAASGQTVPPLDQVRSQVEAQIIKQKQQSLISKFIDQLKSSAKIEILN